MDSKSLCLGALAFGDATGYEIRKLFEDGPFSHFHQASFGSIYPALGALADAGLVDCREMAQDGKPDKKVYHLNDAGREALGDALFRDPAPDKLRSETVFMLVFCQLAGPDRTVQLLDQYQAYYQDKLVWFERNPLPDDAPPGRRFVRGMGHAFYQCILDYIRDNRGELEAAVRAEHGQPSETPS